MDETQRVLDRLLAEADGHLARVGKLPAIAALVSGAWPLDSYVALLAAVAGCWDARWQWLPLVRRDLAGFDPGVVQGYPETQLRALLLSEQVGASGARDPAALLGYLCGVGGSALGRASLSGHLSHHFRLEGSRGLAYLSGHEGWVRAEWGPFLCRLREALARTPDQERTIEAARTAFAGLERIIGSLYPVGRRRLRDLITVLNPEAGCHPIPDDLREVRAALRAGELSWQDFPYYEQRYGTRGKAFTP